jgi:hypothetical protein
VVLVGRVDCQVKGFDLKFRGLRVGGAVYLKKIIWPSGFGWTSLLSS